MARTYHTLDIREHYTWKETVPLQRSMPVFAREWAWKEETFLHHDHDFWEIQLCIHGNAIHQTALGAHPIGPGDVTVLRPGSWHGYDDCRDLVCLMTCFSSSLLHRNLAWTLDDPGINRLLWSGPAASTRPGVLSLHLSPETSQQCADYMRQLWDIGDVDLPRDYGRRLAYLVLILSEIARPLLDEPPTAPPSEDMLVHPVVSAALRLLDEEMAEPWTREKLAERLKIASSYLSLLFRKATSLPPMAYLTRCRAERAASLLLRTELSVAQIGQKVGWGDPNYFARRFRNHFGMTASAYRRRFASGK